MIKLLTKKMVLLFSSALLLLILFLYWQNNSVVITKHHYSSPKLSEEFDGFVISHISDFHNKKFGKNQCYILEKLKCTAPDIIVITGDLIDSRRYNLDVSLAFIEGALEIAPVYYVPGNHESRKGRYPDIRQQLLDAGVILLEDRNVTLTRGQAMITISGVQGTDFYTPDRTAHTKRAILKDHLERLSTDDTFQILLAHRPEIFHLYAQYDMDIIFAGHAHGGQIRLPFIDGIIAPDQGFFPQYTSGCYVQQHSSMYVSRGLGNSLFPFRLFNRPEILSVELHTQSF